MKTSLILLLTLPLSALAQSPFDGTWALDPPLPEKPIEYSLVGGTFHCSGCIVNVDVKADGLDHKVPEADYWDTINVQALDSQSSRRRPARQCSPSSTRSRLTEIL